MVLINCVANCDLLANVFTHTIITSAAIAM